MYNQYWSRPAAAVVLNGVRPTYPDTLENPHIQIYTRIVGRGPGGNVLSSSFTRRQDRENFAELGNALVGVARVTPGNMLVISPSYSVME
jgi:hypothetical protein